MKKVLYTHIIGCATALTVGAWAENAKAEYTNANAVKLHWEVSKDLFPRVFDDSFRRSDFYWLWSATFPSNFKHGKGNLYRIKKATEGNSYHTFHTADELQTLPIDASLKKICKALGSRSFLAWILDGTTVDTICNRSIEANRETTVTFEPCYDGETFFDAYGNGRLKMVVSQSANGEDKGLYRSFDFTFKKEGENVSLTRYDVSYDVGTDPVIFRFYAKPRALPWNVFLTIPVQAGLKMNEVYQNLFDKGSYMWVVPKDHSAARINGRRPYLFRTPDFSRDNNRGYEMENHACHLRKILLSEAFLEGIFGERIWQMLEKHNRCYRKDYDFKVEYTIKPLKNGKYWEGKDPDQFEVYLRISDTVCFTRESIFGDAPGSFEYENFTFIGFRFIFDIAKNEIRDVKFCDKLCLNGELIMKGETEETTWDL